MPVPEGALFGIGDTEYPVVSCQPIARVVAAHRRFDGAVGTDVTVVPGGSEGSPRGWDVTVGDQLTNGEMAALVAVLESPGYVVADGEYVGGPTTCRVLGITEIPGPLEDLWSVSFRLLARWTGGPDPE